MLITTSVLKSIKVPDKCPHLGNLLLTFSTTTYVFIGEEPDMNYEATADIIAAGYGTQLIIPKDICGEDLHFWQTSGADAYGGVCEVGKQ